MNLLMINGDRSILQGKKGAFWYTLEELRTHFDRIDVICPRGAVPAACYQPFENVYFHPSPHSLLMQPFWIRKKGMELANDRKYDVMTVHEYPPFYNGIGAAMLSKRIGIPYVSEIHHLIGEPQAASLSEWIGRLMTRLLLRSVTKRAAKIRTVNTSMVSDLENLGVAADKIEVASSMYLDTDLLSSIPESEKEFDLVFCARLVPNKGVMTFVDVVAELDGVKAVIVGDGPLKGALQDRIKSYGIEDRVVLTGWLSSHEEVISVMKIAKIFVMNSLSEGGPRVALEAMAAGVPVIATPVGLMPDVIDDGVTGVLTTGDHDDLCACITELLGDEEKQVSIANAARSVGEIYERKKGIANYADFLKSVAPHSNVS